MKSRLFRWLWPAWPGLVVPGFWLAYIGYELLMRGFTSAREVLVALWPILPLYAGSCLLAAQGRRSHKARLGAMLAVGVVLAAADLAIKVWIESRQPFQQPLVLLPGLLSIDPLYNVYGTMLAIPGAAPYITVLAVLLVPLSVWGYRYYLRHEEPVIWAHAAFIGLFAGALGKAGDLLWHGLILDYLHIPGLPIADLADIYLLWIGMGCTLAASFCYPETWPDLRPWAGRLARLMGRQRE